MSERKTGMSAEAAAYYRQLVSAGLAVPDIETLPVPLLRFCLAKGNYGAGVYIRHNPQDYRRLDLIFFDGNGLDLIVEHLLVRARRRVGVRHSPSQPIHCLLRVGHRFLEVGDLFLELLQLRREIVFLMIRKRI